jgi:hypothetical protein
MIRHFPPSLIVTDGFRERSDRSWNRGHAIERLSSNATTPLFQKFALHLTHFNAGFMREELSVACLHPLSFPYRLFLLINWDIKDPDHSGLWVSGSLGIIPTSSPLVSQLEASQLRSCLTLITSHLKFRSWLFPVTVTIRSTCSSPNQRSYNGFVLCATAGLIGTSLSASIAS